MEQRAPRHTVLDDKIYRKGFQDFIADIQDVLERLEFLNDPEAYAKQQELRAMEIAAEALILYAERHALKAREVAEVEPDPDRREGLLCIAQVAEHIPVHPPRDFWEAIQAYWFVHLGVMTELNTWDAFNPGHLGHHPAPSGRFPAPGLGPTGCRPLRPPAAAPRGRLRVGGPEARRGRPRTEHDQGGRHPEPGRDPLPMGCTAPHPQTRRARYHHSEVKPAAPLRRRLLTVCSFDRLHNLPQPQPTPSQLQPESPYAAIGCPT